MNEAKRLAGRLGLGLVLGLTLASAACRRVETPPPDASEPASSEPTAAGPSADPPAASAPVAPGSRAIPEIRGAEELLAPVREALQAARLAVVQEPESSAAWGRYGMALDAHDLFTDALPCYRAARELSSDFPWAYLEATMLDFTGAPPEEIVRAFERAIGLNARYPPIFVRYGDALARQGQAEQAAAQYGRAIELDPDFALAHRGLGQALSAQGDLHEALEHLEVARELTPDDGAIHAALAVIHAALGHEQQSREAAERAGELEHQLALPDPIRFRVEQRSLLPRDVRARADAHFARGEYQDAFREYELLGRLRPESAPMRQAMARCLSRLGRTSAAQARLREALALDAELTSARWDLAYLSANAGHLAEAVTQYRKILEREPDNVEARVALASVVARTGDHVAALAEFERAGAAGASSAGFHHDWGTALMRSGDHERAEGEFRRSLQLEPESPNTSYNLAIVLLEQGRREEAIRELERAAALEPGHPASRKLTELGVTR